MIDTPSAAKTSASWAVARSRSWFGSRSLRMTAWRTRTARSFVSASWCWRCARQSAFASASSSPTSSATRDSPLVSSGVNTRPTSVAARGHAGLRDAGLALDTQLECVARRARDAHAQIGERRERGRDLVGRHGRAQADRERRDAGTEITHVERADDRERLNAALDLDETREGRYGGQQKGNLA